MESDPLVVILGLMAIFLSVVFPMGGIIFGAAVIIFEKKTNILAILGIALGFVGFYNPHFAIAYRKSDFLSFEKIGLIELRNTWANRFGEATDINDWAVRYYRNIKGNFMPGKLSGLYTTVGDFKDPVKVISKVKMLVINDDSVRDEATLHNLEKMLNDKFFKKSKYEI